MSFKKSLWVVGLLGVVAAGIVTVQACGEKNTDKAQASSACATDDVKYSQAVVRTADAVMTPVSACGTSKASTSCSSVKGASADGSCAWTQKAGTCTHGASVHKASACTRDASIQKAGTCTKDASVHKASTCTRDASIQKAGACTHGASVHKAGACTGSASAQAGCGATCTSSASCSGAKTGGVEKASAVQCSQSAEDCRAMLRAQYETKGWLGVQLQMRDDAMGPVVLDVVADSPADRAGMRSGDMLTSVNGIAFRGTDNEVLENFMANEFVIGKKLRYTALRGGEIVRLNAELARVPADQLDRMITAHMEMHHADEMASSVN